MEARLELKLAQKLIMTPQLQQAPARNDVSHAASRVLHVAAVARDEVDVVVEDGLALARYERR